jgi:hypothetical protein
MEKIAIDGPKAPIGFLPSVWKGIEYVNTHPGVLILPVLLDSFLWFGPRLSVSGLILPMIDSLTNPAADNPASDQMIAALQLIAQKFNLLSLLSFIPLFPPSLMAGAAPDQSPLGSPVVLPVNNWLLGVSAAGGLILLSLLIGSAYWVWAGSATQPAAWTARDAFGRWARTVLVMLMLSVSLLMLILVLLFPIMFFLSMVSMISPDVAGLISRLVLFLGGGFLFWVVLSVMFSIHGSVLYRDGVLPAVWNSISTSRWGYPTSVWIPLLLILLNFLASSVWSLAPTASWTGAVGVIGNAYTSSVVVLASMAYYIDKRRWISEVKVYLQSRLAGRTPPGAA